MPLKQQSWKNKLETVIAFVLAAGILPALTELSHFLGPVQSITGPISILKLGIPILAAYLWIERARWFEPQKRAIAVVFGVFAFTSFIAAARCGFPKPFLRESYLMLVGAFWGLSFVLLPQIFRIRVAATWVIVVLTSAAIDTWLPGVNLWLLGNVFDASTRNADFTELQTYVLTGVFGRQSLAKLMTWTPWILLLTAAQDPVRSKRYWQLGVVSAFVATGSVLATTQRGALIAAILAALSFFGTLVITEKLSWKLILSGLLGVIVTGFIFKMTVPARIVESRLLGTLAATASLFPHTEDPGESAQPAKLDRLTNSANVNIGFRTAMLDLSVQSIIREPLGNACIPVEEFEKRGLTIGAHSHNLYIEQFRSRGWLWGSLHFALWVGAVLVTWRTTSGRLRASLIAALASFGMTGMFDQIWTVMNHSMLIGVILWLCFQSKWEKKTAC
jgi:hypothetical protein